MIKKIFIHFQSIGRLSSDSSEECRRLFLTNGLAMITFVPPVVYAIVFAFMGLHLLIGLNFLFAGFFLFTMFLNGWGYRYLARCFLVCSLCGAVFLYSLILGVESGIYLVSFAISCVGLVLFPVRDLAGRLISLGMPLVTVIAIFYFREFSEFTIALL